MEKRAIRDISTVNGIILVEPPIQQNINVAAGRIPHNNIDFGEWERQGVHKAVGGEPVTGRLRRF